MRINDQEANRLKVLKAIRRAEPVSRTELVKLTGLSGATVSEITDDLFRRGLLLEARAQAVGRGRPRMQLLLNPDAGYVVGAYLMDSPEVAVEISNARGDCLFARSIGYERAARVEDLIDVIADAIEQVILASPFRKSQIDCVGIGFPGAVDSVRGILHWLQTYPGEPVAIADRIERRLGLPVVVENNINTVVRAEHWFGEDRQVDDFSLFLVGMGLGFGEYVEGALRTGAYGMNSEFSHVKLGLEGGPTCFCGAKGCLVTAASGYGVVLHVCELRGTPVPRKRDLGEVLKALAREARAGDAAARRGFERAGRLLGVAVSNHINMTNPARILVLVELPELADLIASAFYSGIEESVFAPLRGRTPIQFKVSQESRRSHGAAALVLERLYGAVSEPPSALLRSGSAGAAQTSG